MSYPQVTFSNVANQDLKRYGESAAATYLESKGWDILARNWRCRVGELDIVAHCGTTLVFVEVKTRASDSFVKPFLGVDAAKQRRLRRVAEAFIAMERPKLDDCRFDVVSVVAAGGRPRLEHLVAAF